MVWTWGRKTQRETHWIGCPSCRFFPILLHFMARSNWLLHCSGPFKGFVMEPCVFHHWAWRGFRADERNERCCMFTPRKPTKRLSKRRRILLVCWGNTSSLQTISPPLADIYPRTGGITNCNCSGSLRMDVKVVYKGFFLTFPVTFHRSRTRISEVCYHLGCSSSLIMNQHCGLCCPDRISHTEVSKRFSESSFGPLACVWASTLKLSWRDSSTSCIFPGIPDPYVHWRSKVTAMLWRDTRKRKLRSIWNTDREEQGREGSEGRRSESRRETVQASWETRSWPLDLFF